MRPWRDMCHVYRTIPSGGLIVGREVKNTIIYWGLRLLPPCAGILAFALVKTLSGTYRPDRKLLGTYQELTGLLRESRRTGSWYQRREKWIAKNGGAFHYGKRVNPVNMLAVQLVLAALGMMVLADMSWELGVFGGVILYFMPPGLLLYLNYQDNQRLLPELKLVYHAMEIQIRAGVYVMDALAECYGNVQEKRLRTALLELAGDIVMRADIYEAINSFQAKFDNRYVDSLCIIVLQALESGQAVELLGDLGEQIKDMEEVVLNRKKGKLDRSITFYQLAVLASVLVIALYACVTHMLKEAAGL